MNNQPQKRPSKADAMQKKRLATARKKKQQRQLMLYATIVIVIILILVVVCVALIVNNVKKNGEEGEKLPAVSQTTETLSGQSSSKAPASSAVQTTEQTKETEATTDTTESSASTTGEDPAPVGPAQSPVFRYGADGKISSSPSSYDLSLSVEGVSVLTSDYRLSYQNYVQQWYGKLKDRASMDFTEQDGSTWFHLVFNGTDRETRLALRVNGSRISYGAESGMPGTPDAVNFSLNGVTLGSTTEQVVAKFGTPTGQSYSRLTYSFENGSVIYFRMSGGKVSQIYLTWVPFTESN